MKRYDKILLSFSFLLLFIGLNASFVNQANANPKYTTTLNPATNTITFQCTSQPVSHNGIVQIRHRSPHEVDEVAVPNPHEIELYTTNLVEIAPQYYSKWKTYFHVELETLPEDQASPLAHSLRAPPVSC